MNGETLRASFETLDLSQLQEWVNLRQQEDLHIEFKTLLSAPDLSKEDRKNLAISLSGFANSDGGLVIWGVDARKDDDGVDAASGLVPILKVEAVLSKFQSLTGKAASPSVEGVEHKVIPTDSDSGFIATLIPQSDSGPHMAGQGEFRYYKRSGDSFYRLEHFDVADMFGRRASPEIELLIPLHKGGGSRGSSGNSVLVYPTIQIANKGRGVARFPLVGVRSSPYQISSFELDGNGNSGLPKRKPSPTKPYWHIYQGGSDDIIHPGAALDVTVFKVEVHETTESLQDLRVNYQLACEGVPYREGEIVVSGAELLEFGRRVLEEMAHPEG